jgi:DNA-binding transcriptional MerR regulator
LKFIGLSLKEIKALLDDSDLDLVPKTFEQPFSNEVAGWMKKVIAEHKISCG